MNNSRTSFFDEEVEVEPSVLLVLTLVQTLYIHGLAHAYSLIEEDHFLLLSESAKWVRDLDIDLEFDDFAELTD